MQYCNSGNELAKEIMYRRGPPTDPAMMHFSGGSVTKITGRTGWYVDSVALHTGEEKIEYGSSGGDNDSINDLRPGEYICAVTQKNYDVGYLGSSLVFHLSSGRDVAIEGKPWAHKKCRFQDQFAVNEGEKVVGLEFEGSRLVGLICAGAYCSVSLLP
jgi:hypothetical protein